MTRTADIHWLAPTCMIGALLAGVLFAIGHHLFHQSLDGMEVSATNVLELPVSPQEISIAGGTALAFLAKAALVLAMSMAYVQVFWNEAKPPKSEKAPALGALDWTFSALSNVLVFFNLPLWWSFPLLQVMAITTWLIPIAAIITPATLSVHTAAVHPAQTSLLRVPNLDFRSTNLLADMPYNVSGVENVRYNYKYLYNGPSLAVTAITDIVMAQGDIQQITAPAGNTSWKLEFFGPSLRCSNVSDETRFRIKTLASYGWLPYYEYFAWFPGNTGWWNGTKSTDFPFLAAKKNESYVIDVANEHESDGQTGPWFYSSSSLASSNGQNLMISFSISPNPGSQRRLHQCQLFNSTYHVTFNYTSGSQDIIVDVSPASNADVVRSMAAVDLYSEVVSTDNSINQSFCSASEIACYKHAGLLQTLSYQAILDAFTRRIKGTVVISPGVSSSKILQTVLAQTNGLRSMEAFSQSYTNYGPFQLFLPQLHGNEYQGLSTVSHANSQLGFVEAIEQLFQNVTISLMSSAALQPNYTSVSAPPPVSVTFHKYHNIYVYTAWKLWLPYGIAIILCAIAVLVGSITMYSNGSAYSNNFSTIFRAARGANINVDLQEEDLQGSDPLPRYLSKATVWLRKDKSDKGGIALYERVSSPDAPLDAELVTMKAVALPSVVDVHEESMGARSTFDDSATREK